MAFATLRYLILHRYTPCPGATPQPQVAAHAALGLRLWGANGGSVTQPAQREPSVRRNPRPAHPAPAAVPEGTDRCW